MALVVVVFIGVLLAYANGSNDNFKGVATLFGSGTSTYRQSITWATITTALGSVTALVLAGGLLAAFSGKGLVPLDVVNDPSFGTAVALAAGLTVLLAARIGFPISTTHALIGALVGAGLLASPTGINTGKLASTFLLPLLVSPFLAVALAAVVYLPMRRMRRSFGLTQETCVCVEGEVVDVVPGFHGDAQAVKSVPFPGIVTGSSETCRLQYGGQVMGVRAGTVLDTAHYFSAGAVSFARGLNDTPKIAALLLVGSLVNPTFAIIGVALAMALGGLLGARKVAETMSHKVTDMNPGQGFSANIVTSLLVIVASKCGVPISTTHVSCGSLFGIGSVTGQAHWKSIATILLAWGITLPLAGLLGAAFVPLARTVL